VWITFHHQIIKLSNHQITFAFRSLTLRSKITGAQPTAAGNSAQSNSAITLHIGIDPGANTGFAIWDASRQAFSEITTYQVHEAIWYLRTVAQNCNQLKIFVWFEDARQRNWFGRSGPEKHQGAGAIKRECTIWHDFLADLLAKGLITNFYPVAPKNNYTKMPPDIFKQTTGWPHRTSSHARDAAMLVYKR
jgi:hypothetical protein